jgi:hypothetical protein
MSDEFAPEIVAAAWTLKGVGPYGTDMEVVSLDAYNDLAQRCRNAEAACLIWARKALLLENGTVSELADSEVLRALRLPLAAIRKEDA